MTGYKPRQFHFHGTKEAGDICLKLYSITADGRNTPDMTQIGDIAETELLASPIPALPHRGLGYVICHAGEVANWLLIRVWREGEIVMGLLRTVEDGSAKQVEEPLIECIWEAAVSVHEREAWIKAMIEDGGGKETYLANSLEDGAH